MINGASDQVYELRDDRTQQARAAERKVWYAAMWSCPLAEAKLRDTV